MMQQCSISSRLDGPLDVQELHRLALLLPRAGLRPEADLEWIDGFCAALIAGPVGGRPEAYFERLLLTGEHRLIADPEAGEVMALFARHWRAMGATLDRGQVVGPLLNEELPPDQLGRQWASGFLYGVRLHQREWSRLFYDESHNAALFPVLRLACEPRPNPITRIQPSRAHLITDMAYALLHVYRFFAADRAGSRYLHSPVLH